MGLMEEKLVRGAHHMNLYTREHVAVNWQENLGPGEDKGSPVRSFAVLHSSYLTHESCKRELWWRPPQRILHFFLLLAKIRCTNKLVLFYNFIPMFLLPYGNQKYAK